MSKTVLLIDDSELILSMLDMVCAQLGHSTLKATQISDVPPLLEAHRPDVIVSDLNLPDTDDPVAALRTHEALADTPIVLISGIAQHELDAIARDRGARGAISKDAGLPGMMVALGQIFESI